MNCIKFNIMKNKIILNIIISFLFIHTISIAQTANLYIEYSSLCMDRYEFKEKSTGERVLHYYAYGEDPNQKIILELNDMNQEAKSKPSYIIKCSDVRFNQSLIERVNSGKIQIYIVNPVYNGYAVSEVKNVGLYQANDQQISYESFEYDFSYNKNEYNPGKNLAQSSALYDIIYTTQSDNNCLKAYSFRKSSSHTCGTFSDISISPSIGFINMKEKNKDNLVVSHYELYSINGLAIDRYVAAKCGTSNSTTPAVTTTTSTVPSVPSVSTPNTYSNTTSVPTPPAVSTTGTNSRPIIADVPRPSSTTPNTVTTTTSSINNYPDFTNGIPSEFATKGGDIIPSPKKGYYIVKKDETLYSISRITGISIENLAIWNQITNYKKIPVHTELRLTPPTPNMYNTYVQKGGKEVFTPKGISTPVVTSTSPKKINQKPCDVKAVKGIHIVTEGETIYQLAKKYGYTPDKFMEINDLSTDIISPCMALKTSDCSCDADVTKEIPEEFSTKGSDKIEIPSEYDLIAFSKLEEDLAQTNGYIEPIIHVLQKDETIYQIAKEYNVSVKKILFLNDIQDPTKLKIGHKIRIK